MRYAGFWIRFCAAIIDGIVVNILSILAGFVVGLFIGVTMSVAEPEIVEAVAGALGAILGIVISWLYCALMESSPKQATLGKQAMGLRVTNTNGKSIGFGRATGRHFAKIISTIILLIGYIMAGFTEKKQGLHDIIAGTLVVK